MSVFRARDRFAGIGVVLLLLTVVLAAGPAAAFAAEHSAAAQVGGPEPFAQAAVVNMADLARQEAGHPVPSGPGLVRVAPAPPAPPEPGAMTPPFLPFAVVQDAGVLPETPSPGPGQSFAGLDDITNASTGLRYIPPDTDGAVGLTKVMSGLNNNYRIFDKSTGGVLSTVSTDAFWSGLSGTGFFDPKTLYDPINDRWLAVMLANSASASSKICVAISATSDPSGTWWLWSIDADSADLNWADFPEIGFNKNFVAINVNMFGNDGSGYKNSQVLVLSYPAMLAGTVSSFWRVTTGPSYCSSPAATYSATEEILYVPTHWSSNSGTYRLDTITKDGSGAPVYTTGSLKARGVTWTQPGGQILPQQAGSGGGTPLKIESQDAYIRATPVFRDGFIYYTQTVGLPTGGALTRTSILWTKLTASTGDVADGGLVDDPTANATNGGKWYAYPHIAVNKYGDVLVGYSQFSSAQWPSAGYSMRAAGDAAGTMRDPLVYKAGDDVYQKTYGGGRNRWGDYSKAQVDPSNDSDLWVLDEYAKTSTSTGDGGGVWGTWWAKVPALSAATPTLALTSPNGGESWTRTSSHNVTWTVSPAQSSGNFRLLLYDSTGAQASQWISALIPAVAAQTGYSFSWTLTQAAGTHWRVRVYCYNAAGTELARDSSDADFTIANALTLALTSPNGGESWTRTSVHNVTWTVSPAQSSGTFRLLLYDATGAQASQWISALIPAVAAQTGYSFSWTLTQAAGTHWRVRVYCYNSGGTELARDSSDADFTIANALTLALTSPNGGESWTRTSSHNVTWTVSPAQSSGTFRLLLYDASGAQASQWISALIPAVAAQTGYSFSWTLTQAAGTHWRVRVYCYNAAGTELARDSSDADFTIANALTLALTSPNGGESWTRTSVHNVTWTVSPAQSSGTFRLLLYDATGAQASQWISALIPAVAAQTGYSFSWTLTQAAGTHWRVRVYCYNSGGTELARDSSNADFTIAP